MRSTWNAPSPFDFAKSQTTILWEVKFPSHQHRKTRKGGKIHPRVIDDDQHEGYLSVPESAKKRRVSWLDQRGEVNDADDVVASSQAPTTSTAIRPPPGPRRLRQRVTFQRTPEGTLRSKAADPAASPIETHRKDSSAGGSASMEDLRQARAISQHQHLTVMSMELHVRTRQRLLPDPEFDAVEAIFFVVAHDAPGCDENVAAVMAVADDASRSQSHSAAGVKEENVSYHDSESALLDAFSDFVRRRDPDILVGYEVETSSWGYLVERIQALGRQAADLSRLSSATRESGINEEKVRVAGRVVLDIWRLMRSEMALTNYSFENVNHAVLRRRSPKFDHAALTAWWADGRKRWRVFEYYWTRAHGNLDLLDRLDFVGRTSELARLFGIQFAEVLSRGSQFRVESIMLRLAKRRNMVPVSPSIQVG